MNNRDISIMQFYNLALCLLFTFLYNSFLKVVLVSDNSKKALIDM
jgi:hypothetical protein